MQEKRHSSAFQGPQDGAPSARAKSADATPAATLDAAQNADHAKLIELFYQHDVASKVGHYTLADAILAAGFRRIRDRSGRRTLPAGMELIWTLDVHGRQFPGSGCENKWFERYLADDGTGPKHRKTIAIAPDVNLTLELLDTCADEDEETVPEPAPIPPPSNRAVEPSRRSLLPWVVAAAAVWSAYTAIADALHDDEERAS